RVHDILTVVGFLTILLVVMLGYFLKNPTEVSDSERRRLAQLPDFSVDSVLGGGYFDKFETYTNDQFLWRESARHVKAMFRYGVLLKKENHGIYELDGTLIKREEVYKESILKKNLIVWNRIAQNMPVGTSLYYAVIPDKNYFGYAPKMDYTGFDESIGNILSSNFTKIPLSLNLNDYYRTDLHWKQESIYDTATKIAEAMNVSIDALSSYRLHDIGELKGAYTGQSARAERPDRLIVAENDSTTDAEVVVLGDGDTVRSIPVYDADRLGDVDAYSVFLGGPEAAIRIVNPHQDNNRTLVVFRDSFASSLIPYLISGYEQIYLLDLRYMNSSLIPNLGFEKADDVLFLYSYTSLGNLLMK
ncbi:MAG: DHHW family protein, partial [Bacillota bacterium]|nr:DHHW family protein [Bacillota bacterium]